MSSDGTRMYIQRARAACEEAWEAQSRFSDLVTAEARFASR